MIEFNPIGLILMAIVYFPYLIYLFFPPKNHLVRPKEHKQLRILEFMGRMGIVFFSILTIGYGYQIINNIVGIIYVVLGGAIMLFNYFCYARYLYKKRQKEDLFSKFIIPYPIQISECLFILLSGGMLLNPYVGFFGIWYTVFHVLLAVKLKGEI